MSSCWTSSEILTLPSFPPSLLPQDFDAVDFINAKFPSEQAALEALDPFIGQITEEIGRYRPAIPPSVPPSGSCLPHSFLCPPGVLDVDISQAIEAQAKAGEQATKEIAEAQVGPPFLPPSLPLAHLLKSLTARH